MFAIIAEGPNGLEIPLIVMETHTDAEQRIEEFPGQWEGDCYYLDDDFAEVEGKYRTEEDDCVPLYARLFKDGRYYSGCGGVNCLSIRPIIFGEPLVGWDLD